MSHVAIVGSGLIGRAWALVFARAGWSVTMTDASADVIASLEQRLSDDFAILERHGLAASAADTLARIKTTASIEGAVREADFVQENGPEDCAIKQQLFAEIDRHAPDDAILASSTSAIVASRFTESLAGRARCLVGHPVNPPHLIPVVEICGAPWTSDAVIAQAKAVYAGIGQVPVMVNKEVEGFVLNRLQGAVLAEAFRLVADGVVSPQDLDETVKNGLGLRWSFMGPFETIDLNAPGGIADYCARYCDIYRRLADDPPTSSAFDDASTAALLSAWSGKPDPDRLAAATAWRNERLAALRAHKQTQTDQ